MFGHKTKLSCKKTQDRRASECTHILHKRAVCLMLSNMSDTALNVFIGNNKLPQCNSIKYLGVDIDNVLSWNLQTDSISKKLVFIISRLMNVIQRRDYFMLIMMFKSIHGLVPDYICDQITMQRDFTVRTTRSTVNNNVHVPHILLECCKNAFAYRGPVLWNALPENIKKCETLNCFKKCVKLHVVE